MNDGALAVPCTVRGKLYGEMNPCSVDNWLLAQVSPLLPSQPRSLKNVASFVSWAGFWIFQFIGHSNIHLVSEMTRPPLCSAAVSSRPCLAVRFRRTLQSSLRYDMARKNVSLTPPSRRVVPSEYRRHRPWSGNRIQIRTFTTEVKLNPRTKRANVHLEVSFRRGLPPSARPDRPETGSRCIWSIYYQINVCTMPVRARFVVVSYSLVGFMSEKW